MSLARKTLVLQDEQGNILQSGTITVRREGTGSLLGVLYSDRDGTTPKANPFTFNAADNGIVFFHAAGAAYRIRVVSGDFDQEYRYVGVGTAQEVDANSYLTSGWQFQVEASTSAPPSDGSVRFNNADLSLATKAYFDYTTANGSDASAILLALGPGSKSVKNKLLFTSQADGTTASWDVTSVTDHTTYVEVGLASHAGATTFGAVPVNVFPVVSGPDGFFPGISLVYSSTTTAADPGAGKFRFNNATHASATAAYLDNVEALGGASITSWLDSFDDSNASVKGQLLITSKADPSIFRLYNVTGSVTDSTGYRTIVITYVTGSGTLSDTTACVLGFTAAGLDGYSPGYRLTFDTTTTDSDPGNGKVRFNNATFASITFVYVDNQDSGGSAITTWLDGLDDVSNANARAYLRFQKGTDPSVYAEFAVTGAVVDGTGYRKIPVSPIAGAVPANGAALVASASKSGADGGAGLPDQDRRNALLVAAGQAKALAGYQRMLNTFVDGYKASDGVNSGSSSNYAVNTSNGYVGPTSNTRVLMHFDGSNGSTTFTDSSSQPVTASVGAGSPSISTSQSKIGGASLRCPSATLDNSYVKITDRSDLALGAGDFTLECWVRFDSTLTNDNVQKMFWAPVTDSATRPTFYIYNQTLNLAFSGSNRITSSAQTWTGGVWYHVAIVRSGSTLTAYKDGVSIGTGTDSTTWTAGTDMKIGSGVLGYIDELRISIGTARWTSGFTPSTTAYSADANNMTLLTTSQTADASVSNGRVLLEIDPIDSITLNTDLTAEVTCDAGSHWSSATLSNVGKGQSGRTVVETADTAATGGTSFAARIKTLNNKSVNIYKTAMVVH